MLIVLQMLTGVLLVFSFVGYMLLIRKTLSLKWEFIPVFVFSSIACIVFFSGLAGQLFIGSLVVMIVGLLAFVLLLLSCCAKVLHFVFLFPYFRFHFL